MADAFDLVVIGAGPGGYVAAIRASQLGLKTAIVEREALGGVCLNWGCIPTKALLKSGELYETLGHLGDYGLSAKDRGYDFAAVIERSRKVANQLSSGVAFLMRKHKIEVIDGTARLEKGAAAPRVRRRAQGRQVPRARRQGRDPGHRGSGADDPGHRPRARRRAHLDLSRGDGSEGGAEVT